ncbi:MAG: hypothetical protein Q8N37_04485 [bacterium]|nr:hypothetical protein [bacterium]
MEKTKSPITISEETQIDRPVSRKFFSMDYRDWFRLKKMISRISDGQNWWNSQNWWSNFAWFTSATSISSLYAYISTPEIDVNKKYFFYFCTIFSFITTIILFFVGRKFSQSNFASKKEILEEMNEIEQGEKVTKDDKEIVVEPEKLSDVKEKVKKPISLIVMKADKEDMPSGISKNKNFGDGAVNINISEIILGWNSILKGVKNYDHSVSAFLKLSTAKEIKKNLLVIATPYKFHAEKLSEPANRLIIEKVIAEVFPKILGMKIQVIQDENIKITSKRVEE